MKKLEFSLKTTSLCVVLNDVNGQPEEFQLREMVASARDGYLDTLSERISTDETGKATGVRKFNGIQSDLLSCCLFRKDNTLVQKDEIQGWPSSVVSSLFEEAQKLNHLTKDDSPILDAAKKE